MLAVAPPPQLQAEAPLSAPPVDLLEALLASCKPAPKAPLPGFGRTLQPYFAPGDAATPPAAQKPPAGRNSPKRAQRKAAQAAAAATVAAAAKKAQKKAATPAKPATTPATPAPVPVQQAPFILATPTSWAGPGFCISPLPDQLPLPTAALLN